jgi:prepilin-type N-terminal cleavage/methylation domain-containing protein
MDQQQEKRAAFSLTEVLCVMVIIAILAALLLPTVAKAYNRIKGAADLLEADRVADMLLKETRGYCTAHPQYSFGSKSDLVTKCVLAPKCQNWVQASTTVFVPFTYLDPTNEVVLSVYLGPKHATIYSFTISDLSIIPQR